MTGTKEAMQKRKEEVLAVITPMLMAFGMEPGADFEYIVKDTLQTETLRIHDTYIGCSGNSLSAIGDEIVGYLFVKRFIPNQQGRIDARTARNVKNAVGRYWLGRERLIMNGFAQADDEDNLGQKDAG